MLIFGTIIARIAAFMGWRWYDGRGYPLSEIIGWALGAALGATSFGLNASWQQVAYGLCIGVLATWCIVRSYKQTDDGWHDYKAMALRSIPALGIPGVCVVASMLGLSVTPFEAVAVPAMCFAANLTQVPLRRHQRAIGLLPADQRPRYGAYMADICEIYEAAWIGAALVLMGVFYVG